MIRGAGRRSWTKRKAKASVQSLQALEDLKVMAFFAISSKSEATRETRRPSWTRKNEMIVLLL